MKGKKGYSLLRNPHHNKDTAFTPEEKLYHLEGLLPDKIETIETQILRIKGQLNQLNFPFINTPTYLIY
jgi:malate dehydrogenase (oxaloacetate-decarboxylating)(NADP+)